MESARYKFTGKVIEAQKLRNLQHINSDDYICCGCDAGVTPCSYYSHSKRRAYFRLKKNHNHKVNCKVEVEIELIKRAKTGRIATKDGFPARFPSKLVLKNTRSVTIPNSVASSIVKSKSSAVQYATNDITKNNHHYTVGTIWPICRQFLNFPFDRDLPLIISYVSGDIYQDVFGRLNEIIKYHTQQIFYAPLSWKKAIRTDDYLEIYLNAGEWGQLDDSKKGYVHRYKVMVNWKKWKKTKKDTFFSELETARLETKTADENRAVDKDKHKVRGWFFFIGKQDDSERTVFHVEDKRLIYFLVAEMIYPKSLS